MFTGIIEQLTEVHSITSNGTQTELKIVCHSIASDAKIGDSIAINGVCLTISKIENKIISFAVSPETIKRTNLKKITTRDKINIERALLLTSRLDGHIVQGHVDCVASTAQINKLGNDMYEFAFKYPPEYEKYFAEKGSVAINGISLTISKLNSKQNILYIAVIPLTFSKTNLQYLKLNDEVNIEVDVIARYLEKLTTTSSDNDKQNNLMHGLLNLKKL